jgi:hypothetical protein
MALRKRGCMIIAVPCNIMCMKNRGNRAFTGGVEGRVKKRCGLVFDYVR